MKRAGSVLVAVAALLAAWPALAQVPPDIEAKIREIGPVIDGSIMPLYAAILPSADGIEITRNQAYGKDGKQKLDVSALASKSRFPRPVLIFVHGGGFVRGDKHESGSPFYDNVLAWAARNGLVGVNINYRLAPKAAYPAGAQDLAAAIAWTRAHIAEYGGDPDRIYIWGHSAGANHVVDYISRPELQGPEAEGVKGAIVLSAMYPKELQSKPNSYYGVDPDTLTFAPALKRLEGAKVPIFLAGAELDPPAFVTTREDLKAGLCAAGKCPSHYLVLPGHDHLSPSLAVGTKDQLLTGPMLDWIRAQK
jgi:triacylglycerol lipase